MGETCGMRLVYETVADKGTCKICQKIAVKSRRKKQETCRYETWALEGRLGSLKATVQKCFEGFQAFGCEISALENERDARKLQGRKGSRKQEQKQSESVKKTKILPS